MRFLIIDNYDSFTYNLHHYLEDILKETVKVYRNDDSRLNDLREFTHLVFSPGPGLPTEAGSMMEIIRQEAGKKKMLGICLGMQAMALCFHGKLSNLTQIVHGMPTQLLLTQADEALYRGITQPIEVGRYHSWVVEPESVQEEFYLTAFNPEGLLMSFRHKVYPLTGVQFHPESILTPSGKQMLQNFITL